MKKIALAGVVLAASVLLAGCTATDKGQTAGPAPTQSAGGSGCVNGEADFTASKSKNTLVGVCKKVVISGDNMTLTASDVTDLTVSGKGNTITTAVLGSVTVVGDSNTVKTTTAGPVTVNGNGNTVTALGPIGDVSVNGANDTVTTPGKMGTITQAGIGNKIGAP